MSNDQVVADLADIPTTEVEDATILSETRVQEQETPNQPAPKVNPLTMLASRAAHHFATLPQCATLETNLDAMELAEGHTRTRNGLMTGFAAGFEEGYKYANQLLVTHVAEQPASEEQAPAAE